MKLQRSLPNRIWSESLGKVKELASPSRSILLFPLRPGRPGDVIALKYSCLPLAVSLSLSPFFKASKWHLQAKFTYLIWHSGAFGVL